MYFQAKNKDEMETSTDVGLVIGHAYGITGMPFYLLFVLYIFEGGI